MNKAQKHPTLKSQDSINAKDNQVEGLDMSKYYYSVVNTAT